MHSHKEHEPELSGAERELMAALGRLRPCAPGLSPERLMFQAGERAGRRALRRQRGLGAALALGLACSLGLNGLLLGRAAPSGNGDPVLAVAHTPIAGSEDSAPPVAPTLPAPSPDPVIPQTDRSLPAAPLAVTAAAPRPIPPSPTPASERSEERDMATPAWLVWLSTGATSSNPPHPMSSLALRETALRQGVEALPVPPGGGEVLRASDAWTYPDLLPHRL